MLTESLYKAALGGLEYQKSEIEAKIAEIREALGSPDSRPTLAQIENGLAVAKRRGRPPKPQGLAAPVPDWGGAPRPKRHISARGRANIVKATKKRWREFRLQQGHLLTRKAKATAGQKKPVMSAAGRAKIARAMRKRWAAYRRNEGPKPNVRLSAA